MKVVGMIPARLQSRRLPEKALVDIIGMPMIVHTCKRSAMSKLLDEVYLATDSERIRKVAESYDIKVIMTGSHHSTGSDRIAEAIQDIPCNIVVNIQGDEPLVEPNHIDYIVQELLNDQYLNCALGVTKYNKKNSPSDIKAVLDLYRNVLYCSRTDLPNDTYTSVKDMYKMCFVVAFRKDFLLKYASWSPTPLEQIEYNEYLRILEYGEKLRAVELFGGQISVDTPEDLEVVRKIMNEDKLRLEYC